MKPKTTKTLNLIHRIRQSDIEGLLLSTDTEKAFDRVSWDYMYETCKHIGFGNSMMTWVKSLYINPSAKIKMNDTYSDSIEIHNGTRQGCPLSPLLFILSIEPLIRTINLQPSIHGFNIDKRDYKLAAYADDLLFYITQPHISIPNLNKTFQDFKYLSNLKINHKKCEVLGLTLSKKT